MEKLKISIGILSWKSGQTLVDTLTTYYQNGLLEITDDIKIIFQEISNEDITIANHFGINYIGLHNNIGIGEAFYRLAEQAKYDNILLLEHDWQLIENIQTTLSRLSAGISLLNDGYQCVRYRHRHDPGYPHFSIIKYKNKELEYFDPEFQLEYPHLLDCVHWKESPDLDFSFAIQKMVQDNEEFYISTSRYGNWTNNPCLYKKSFYLECINQFKGSGIDLEGKISRWWAFQNYKVAHGEGLFKHVDLFKYGK